MDKILAQFGVQPVLLAAQIVNFFILLFILKKFLYKPILKTLEARKQRIAQSLKQAEEIEIKMQKANEEADKILGKGLEQSKKILDETNKAGAQMLEDYNRKGAEILQRAVKEASKLKEVEREKLMQEVKENLGSLVVVAFEKVTGKALTEKQRKDIIEKEVRNIL